MSSLGWMASYAVGLPGSWSLARDLGMKRYFTGVPCVRGHLSPRYTANCKCVQCHQENRLADPGQIKRYWESIPLEERRARRREMYVKNRDKRRAEMRAYYYRMKAKRSAERLEKPGEWPD